jgi:hypothetical protein
MSKTLTAAQKSEALRDLRALHGDSGFSMVYNDGIFANSLVPKYGMSLSELEVASGYRKAKEAEKAKKTVKTMDRDKFGEEIARAMEPTAWAEYDAGKGVCSNGAGQRVLHSMVRAGLVLRLLEKKGAIQVPKQSKEGAALLDKYRDDYGL